MDIHVLQILITLQMLILAILAGVVVGLVNLKRAVDWNASAGWEIEDRLKNLSSTLYEITKHGDTKNLFEGLKENKAKEGEPGKEWEAKVEQAQTAGQGRPPLRLNLI